MKFSTVRLISKSVYKVVYKGKKWAFKKGVDYPDIHPDFAAHLDTLRDDNKNRIFEIDRGATVADTVPEHSEPVVQKVKKTKAKRRKKTKANAPKSLQGAVPKVHKLHIKKKE